MWNWIRKLPHPGYGKCGSAPRDCSTKPVTDWLDLAFEQHDEDLRIASKEAIGELKKLATLGADRKLAKALREGDPKKLKLWGRIYLFGAKMVFKT